MTRNGRKGAISDEEFIKRYNEIGARPLARELGQDSRAVFRRASRFRSQGVEMNAPQANRAFQRYPHRIDIDIDTGFIIVASDCHYWPNEHTLMHKALVWACKEFKPQLVVLNGDVMDFPSISRFPPIGWEKQPEVADEIEFAQEKTHEIALAAGRRCRRTWTLGNHDKRFETRIATHNPQLARVKGVHLRDHFPEWEPCWSTYINPDLDIYSCLITHRFRGGIHDTHNNMLWTGNHVVTGHTHNAQVRALTYYNERTIWGVNTGMCSEPMARAFVDYTEDNPKNWRSAFGVLRWENRKLLMPQLVLKFDEKRVQVGGELVTP